MKSESHHENGRPKTRFTTHQPDHGPKQPAGRTEPRKHVKDSIDLPPGRNSEWTIPEAAREVIPSEMVKAAVMRDGATGEYKNEARVRIAASQALVAMNRQNQTSATARETDGSGCEDSPEQIRARLVALAERLQLGELAEAALSAGTKTDPPRTE